MPSTFLTSERTRRNQSDRVIRHRSMMLELQGIPVSPGVAIGPALVLDADGYRIPRCIVPASDVEDEFARLHTAVDLVSAHLEHSRLETTATAGRSTGDIFAAQLQMLHDPRLHSELQRRIGEDRQSAAFAVSGVLHNYASALRRLDNPLLADRAQDVLDIERQLLMQLGAVTRQPLSDLSEPVIVLSHMLTPSETANLDRRFVKGFCTETGGPGGHTAIVAKGLEIPAVVGIGDFLHQIAGSNCVIVDGDRGKLIVDPDDDVLENYRERAEYRRSLAVRLAELSQLPAETTDGVRIQLNANIEFPHETVACIDRGADGIGLYRTEFLYLSSDDEPSEEDHYQAYSEVVQKMDGRPVVIRTLDLGADKMGRGNMAHRENNPFLGLRSIRLSLRNLDVFRPQLRAVLRAAVHGDVRVMFPLITTINELRQARMLLNVVAEDLQESGLPYRSDLPVGMMVEVPAAVMMLEHFASEVDFFSIGTNDLAQYTLAVDRSNEYVADLYQSSDPAVLRLIQHSIDVAAKSQTPVSVCGEMSSNPGRALLLLGMGVRNLSVPPSALPRVKKVIRNVSIDQCKAIAERVMKLEAARDVDLYLLDRLSDLAPELVMQ
ncbi:phosphoenolpyruvate--protein phosphotransferase [Rhodopirellula baltica]|uniref:Phosphoenolpyruvate-protein phosphotransferase n=3 Tax=Rhodopirellula baltica TaxID=265606 RepID=Q7UMU0_RHOBA|nr:phosphoenolpyruvate--protein phosphotransferase [Rhodopirellula baltica]EGF25090.1 phosphoenolpyruvate-protein phosphotransferase [Rhodopirellula baltica WH47]CAD75813.1 phosphoenolpyruvate-protein phosphotransferase [Rhodopirellula baltica SH 1]HBE65413.1 phosphoenolpyruvate--protein phosphotransferase [Rhodopirellula baltica]